MRNFKVIAVALVLVVGVGCKKKKATDGGGGTTMGTNSGTGGTMAGSGSDNTMAGSGSDNSMAGSGSAAAVEPPKKPEIVTILAADMKWGPMDPSSPEPQVTALWGDMTKEPNGFLIKVKAGSAGMHHTHSTGYNGITISGSPNHLQDGDKKPVALPAGSYWFEPGGVGHTSQCLDKKVDCVALVHFNDGKADFAPAEFKKDGKRDPKYVEKPAKDIKFVALMPDMKDKGPMISDVWGDSASGPHGRLWKFPAGFASPAHTHGADYHAVVIKGTVMNYAPDDKAPKEMGPGSYWMQPGNMAHVTACKAGAECLVYTYTMGKFDFTPSDAAGAGSGAAAGSGDMKGSADMKGGSADMKGSAK